MYAVSLYNWNAGKWETVKEADTQAVANGYAAQLGTETGKRYAVIDLARVANSRKFFNAFQTLNTPTQDDNTAYIVYRLRDVLEKRYGTIV